MIKDKIESFRSKLDLEVKKHFPSYFVLSVEQGRYQENKPGLNVLILDETVKDQFTVFVLLPSAKTNMFGDLTIKFIIGNIYRLWMKSMEAKNDF